MLKVKFKKMLKENQEQTDKNALAAIRTEFSKRVPNLDLVLSLASKSEMSLDYFIAHLKDLGILDRFINIHTELSKETPNLLSIMKLAANNEALVGYACYTFGIQEIDRFISGDLEKGFFGGEWQEAWDAVSYDPEREIEYPLEVRFRLAEHYIERLKDIDENPMDVLEQLTDLKDGTEMQDLGEYKITIDYSFLTPPLQDKLEEAIEDLVDFRYDQLKSTEDFEDTARSSWYY